MISVFQQNGFLIDQLLKNQFFQITEQAINKYKYYKQVVHYTQMIYYTFPILCPGCKKTETKLFSKNVGISTFNCLPIVVTVCGI